VFRNKLFFNLDKRDFYISMLDMSFSNTYKFPSIIKDVMCVAYAKIYGDEKETLGTHTAKLLKCSNTIYKLFNDKHPINKELLRIAIKFHDIGKCERSWVDNKILKVRDIHKDLSIRHEVLSFIVCYHFIKNESFSDYEKLLILMPILLHHNKYITVGDRIDRVINSSSTMLIGNGKKIEWLHGLSSDPIFKNIETIINTRDKNTVVMSEVKKIISKLSVDLTLEQSYDIQYHAMILCACDHMASANYSMEEIESFFKINFSMGDENSKYLPRDYQKYVIDTFDMSTDILFMDFRPGAGKTLVSENIANKLNRCIIHGTPKNIIANDLASKFLGDKDLEIETTDDLESMSIDSIRQKSRWFAHKRHTLYTTPDNIFLMSQGFKRHFMFLRALYNGMIVFDEFHDCYSDDYRRFNLYGMVEKFLYFKIPMLFMSGTVPSKLMNKVMMMCKTGGKSCHIISDEGNVVNHIHNNKKVEVDIKLENRVRGKISFFSGEPDTRKVSGLPWWDEKSFEMGYFTEIKKLIDAYVAKNESVAICFASKKTIFQFIHMFDMLTNYKHKEDYAIICSPNMVDGGYVPTILKALGELKKGSHPKNRTFKFVLCTSYTEMGVDFSVQHMIIETSFIQNLDQQLGRLNRWGEYGSHASCTIFPAFTRYTDEETRYRQVRYGSDTNYHKLNSFYMNKGECDFNSSWYTQKDLDMHYDWFVNDDAKIKWDYINTCGAYRTDPIENTNNGINGMYRKVDTVVATWNGVDFSVPLYRIDRTSGKLNIIPHPDLFV
jgi:CRISPR-associated endonuclease Cas3-HD